MRIAVYLKSIYNKKQVFNMLGEALHDYNHIAEIRCFKNVDDMFSGDLDGIDFVICNAADEKEVSDFIGSDNVSVITCGGKNQKVKAYGDKRICLPYGFTKTDIVNCIFGYEFLTSKNDLTDSLEYVYSTGNYYLKLPLDCIDEFRSYKVGNVYYVKITSNNKEEFSVRDTISNINEKLKHFGFVKIQNGLIVPVSRISSFTEKSVYLTDNSEYHIGLGTRRIIIDAGLKQVDNVLKFFPNDNTDDDNLSSQSLNLSEFGTANKYVFRICIDKIFDDYVFGRVYCEYTRNWLVFTNISDCVSSLYKLSKSLADDISDSELSLSLIQNGFSGTEYDNIRVWNKSSLYKKTGKISSMWVHIECATDMDFRGDVSFISERYGLKVNHFDSKKSMESAIKSINLAVNSYPPTNQKSIRTS